MPSSVGAQGPQTGPEVPPSAPSTTPSQRCEVRAEGRIAFGGPAEPKEQLCKITADQLKTALLIALLILRSLARLLAGSQQLRQEDLGTTFCISLMIFKGVGSS